VNRKYGDLALLVLRLGTGLGLALAHGLPKVMGLLRGESRFVEGVAQLGFPYPTAFAWAAAVSELAGGVCLALGLLTRLSAGVNVVTMAVAAFVRHRAHLQLLGVLGLRSYAPATLEAWGKPEMALLYLMACVALALMGAGAYSVDGAMVGGRPPGMGKGRAKKRK
jgi:putative oxidoreductase